MDKTKFGIGDKVRIVNYGHIVWITKKDYRIGYAMHQAYEKSYLNSLLTGNFESIEPDFENLDHIKPKNLIKEDDNYFYYDISPEMVGQIGIISKAQKTQSIDNYSIDRLKGKCSWYHNDQLKLINKNPNNES